MKDFDCPNRAWARVREDQEAEITFFDAMTTTSVFLLQSGRSSPLNQLNLVISFPRTSVGWRGEGGGELFVVLQLLWFL